MSSAPPPNLSKLRLILGGSVFILAQLAPLFIPLVTGSQLSVSWKTTLSGFLLLGIPELGILTAIAILGKPGYEYFKSRIRKLLRRHGPPQVVSRTRYHIGLVMFLLPMLYGLAEPYVGHWIPFHDDRRLTFAIILDATFLLSFFVLGGEFWDKIRALFVYRARAEFPQKDQA